MKNARVENPKLVTHVNATKSMAYWKASAQGVAMPVMKPPVSAPVPTVNNACAACAAKITKNILAYVDNMTGKTKKNMMLSVKKVKVKRVNVPA